MYFNKFPFLEYLNRFDSPSRIQLVTDVLRRVKINTQTKEDSTFFVEYDCQEGDTPENISHRLYESSDFFWVVLLINEALNPYYSFPLDSNSLENYIKKKYAGKYFYLVDPTNQKQPSGLTFSSNQTVYSSSAVKDDFGVTKENYTVRARVISHEPSLCRIFVDGGEHTYFTEGDLIGIVSGSDVKQAKIKRIEDGKFGLHHFGTGTADYLNPLASVVGDVPLGFTASGTYATTSPQYYETKIGSYLGLSGDRNTNNTVNNFEHESTQNDTRRSIKLVHPDFLPTVVETFEKVMEL